MSPPINTASAAALAVDAAQAYSDAAEAWHKAIAAGDARAAAREARRMRCARQAFENAHAAWAAGVS